MTNRNDDITIWGPIVWTLFHTMAEQIRDENDAPFVREIFDRVCDIAADLPCADCSQHASRILTQMRHQLPQLETKKCLRNRLYLLHNMVNKRLEVPMYHIVNTYLYQQRNVGDCFQQFVAVMGRSHRHHRMEQWMSANLSRFLLPSEHVVATLSPQRPLQGSEQRRQCSCKKAAAAAATQT